MKLAANLLLAVFWQTLGESLFLVENSGTDIARAIDLLADSNISAGILRVRAPQIVAAAGKVQNFARVRIEHQGVDGEVAAQSVLARIGFKLHRVRVAAIGVRTIAAEGGHLHLSGLRGQ